MANEGRVAQLSTQALSSSALNPARNMTSPNGIDSFGVVMAFRAKSSEREEKAWVLGWG